MRIRLAGPLPDRLGDKAGLAEGAARVGKAEFLAFAAHGIAVATGLVTALLIARFSTPAEQGYYYTFRSLFGLAPLLDFGMSQAVLVLTGLWGALDSNRGGSSEREHLWRIGARWAAAASLTFAVTIGTVGTVIVAKTAGLSYAWIVPWVVGLVACACQMRLDIRLAVLQGLNQRVRYWQVRLLTVVSAGLGSWALIVVGRPLWAATWFAVSGVIVASQLTRRLSGLKPRTEFSGPIRDRAFFLSRVWPFQWRGALAWASVALALTIFTPIVLWAAGPDEAGRFGMSASLAAIVFGSGNTYLVSRLPLWPVRWVRFRLGDLGGLARELVPALSLSALTAALIGVGLVTADRMGIHISARILPAADTLTMVAGAAGLVYVNGVATFLRARGEEELYAVLAVTTILMCLAGVALVSMVSVRAAVVAFAATIILVQCPAVTIAASRRRQEARRRGNQ